MWDTDPDIVRVNQLAKARGLKLRRVYMGDGESYLLVNAETFALLDPDGTQYTLFEAEERLRALPAVG